MAASLLLLCLFCLGSVKAGKLLVVPSDGSHWTGMRPLVEELGLRGNQVVVVIPEASLSMGPSQHTTTLTYPVPYTKTQLQEQVNSGVTTLTSTDLSTDVARFQSFVNTLDLLNVLITRNAEGLLSNKTLMKKLQDYNFDAILTDPFETVGPIAAEYLSIPAIYIQTSHPCGVDALASQCPNPASYVPQPLTHFTDHMNLWQRSVNLVRTLFQPMACRRMFARADEIASHVLQRKTSMVEIMSRAALWFVHSDFAFAFPRPLMPNMIIVGGMDSKKAKPLSQVTEAGKLLVVPSDGSHWLGMKPIVEELGRRGNQVVVVIPEASLSMGPSQNTTTLTFPVNYTKAELHALLEGSLTTILSIDISSDLSKFLLFFYQMNLIQSFIVRNAEGLLFNEDLMKKLRDYSFDAILTDPFEPIGVIVSEYLSIPAIYMQINLPCGVDILASQCPSPPSYVPQRNTHFTDQMNLWQRSVNLVRTLLQPMACRYMYTYADEIASRVLQRKSSMVEIMGRAALWFMRFDFAFEFPRPLMPNMVMIGGMATKKPKPLSQRGHEMLVLVPETSVLIRTSGNYTTNSFRVPYTLAELNASLDPLKKSGFEKPPQFNDIFENLGNLMHFTDMQVKGCEGLLYDEPLMKSLRETEFDVLLTDPFLPCRPIIASSFSLPAIYFLRGIPCWLDESAAQCPSPPSFVPRLFTSYSDKMTFPQRARNTLMKVFERFLCRILFASFDELASRYLQKDTTYEELLGLGAVWLHRYDFTFEFPKPQMPNMVQIGGINCAKRGPLTKLEKATVRDFFFCNTIDKMAAVWLLLSLFFLGSAEAGKLLVIPSDGSHWLGMKPIVEELGRRGSQVVVVIPEASLSMGPSQNTTTFPVNYTKAELHALLEGGLTTILSIDLSSDLSKFLLFFYQLNFLQSFIVRNAEGLLFNEDLMKKLRDYSFDAILTDPFEPIGVIVSEYLSIPAIYMQINLPCGVDTLASQCPSPPSYVPQRNTHFTVQMNLWQRFVNLVRTLLQPMACRYMHTYADEIASRVLQRKTSMVEIMGRAALWFMRFDFAFEFPRPLMPNMVMIGGMATKNPKPLSQVSSHKYICMQLNVHLH
ncbi:UDP-glucuronosyltransferase 1-1 [Anabarilius grahami]|uniref:UDP-glucuronosyltransferase 1-1 n=1 Tax=Anabarilius grahami TaxID=495550 RepID=A0A3N0Z231_ANAGA|nr:UDP-glucuronosyltransferase 1-1 [Anabarilius grahami]